MKEIVRERFRLSPQIFWAPPYEYERSAHKTRFTEIEKT